MLKEESIEIGGQKLSLQAGKLAPSADAAVFARLGDTCVLATVVVGQERPDIDFVPLQVEYIEKLYAGGRIKGSPWVKREGRPSDEVILKARLVDRSIRPLFPKNWRKEVQVVITLLSVDGINSPDTLAVIAASAALHLSPVPWEGPIACSRVGYVKGEGEGSFVLNPTEEEQEFSVLDLVVSSTREKVVMIEALAEELPEDLVDEAIERAKQENKKIIELIESFASNFKVKKEEVKAEENPLKDKIRKEARKEIEELVKLRVEKSEDYTNKFEELVERFSGGEEEKAPVIKAIKDLEKEFVRESVLEKDKRVDGRGFDEIRELKVEVSLLPRTHGSALFQRGNTQVLSIVTLGSPHLEQLIEGPEGQEVKRYMHHYYMPPYSVGEIGRFGFPSRREVGHGALAEKALIPVLPSEKEFPYAIRVVSEVLSSNGSTSMASVCGSTLALMDAGVPIKSMVAGIALGLFSKSDEEYKIVTDILGLEDFAGEMDFKIAGSEKGITAIQLDVKNKGLTRKMIQESLEKAKKARLFILEKMREVIDRPRQEISRFAPKVVVITPPQEKIGDIIGPGGKNIRALMAKTGTEIVVNDDGEVVISGPDKEGVKKAAEYIQNIVREISLGEVFEGEVKRLLPFGAIVELFPGREGLIHVSNMGRGVVKDPSKVVKVGQKVKVKVVQIDNMGRISLRLLTPPRVQKRPFRMM